MESGRTERSQPKTTERERVNVTPRNREPQPGPSSQIGEEIELAEHIIIDAEQLKANNQAPKGNLLNYQKLLQKCDDDDEFFHVTCHINGTLRGKIARGEYVDLEQLLPRGQGSGGYSLMSEPNDESTVEIVSKDGHTYFKPMKDNQITGLKKWEQAFRVYAAIYTEHNPERSGEIWQYIHTINIAASSFQWDNVSNYDNTFRHLMSAKPHHSWAKLYNQGWNLAMRDPVSKVSNQGMSQSRQLESSQGGNGGGKRNKSWRDYCCWKFNRNKCNDSGCGFDHRCTFCGGWYSHGFYNCRKKAS